MEPDNRSLRRRYFIVYDSAGTCVPAVEYWAASLDEMRLAYHVVPLRRYVKLLGSGEYLEDRGGGVRVSTRSARAFTVSDVQDRASLLTSARCSIGVTGAGR